MSINWSILTIWPLSGPLVKVEFSSFMKMRLKGEIQQIVISTCSYIVRSINNEKQGSQSKSGLLLHHKAISNLLVKVIKLEATKHLPPSPNDSEIFNCFYHFFFQSTHFWKRFHVIWKVCTTIPRHLRHFAQDVPSNGQGVAGNLCLLASFLEKELWSWFAHDEMAWLDGISAWKP